MKKNNRPKEIYLDREKCNCVAQKHQLINNCLGCGKVVCSREGEGPCLYCGHIVTRPDGKYLQNDESLFPSLSKEELTKVSKQRSKAVIHKNKLVQRDKSTNMAQNIYDESIDYYDVSENQWLDEDSRQTAIDRLLQKDKYIQSQQFKQKIVFDPVSGKFITEEFYFDQEQFKDEGKNFLVKKQESEYKQKMEKAKSKFDKRIMQNQKVKQLLEEMKIQNKQKKIKNLPQLPNKNKVTEFIVEQEEQNDKGQE